MNKLSFSMVWHTSNNMQQSFIDKTTEKSATDLKVA